MIKLLKVLSSLGAPISLPASDEILCLDIDQLRDLDPKERLPRLRKAKREALCLHLENHVALISEAAGRDQVVATMLLGGFIGSNDPSTPYSHATLGQLFYGKPLTSVQIARWTLRAMQAARPAAVSQAADVPYLSRRTIVPRRLSVLAHPQGHVPLALLGDHRLRPHLGVL